MNCRYTLSEHWVAQIAEMAEFAMGGTQVTVRLKDGRLITGVLISNCTHPIAVRGFKDLPFGLEDIADIFQTEEDRNPKQRGGWHFWDDWFYSGTVTGST
jgi:hypothetical protein